MGGPPGFSRQRHTRELTLRPPVWCCKIEASGSPSMTAEVHLGAALRVRLSSYPTSSNIKSCSFSLPTCRGAVTPSRASGSLFLKFFEII